MRFGCRSPESPLAPSRPLAQSPSGTARPNVTAVVPAVDSVGRRFNGQIVGTGFMPGMTVMFNDITVTALAGKIVSESEIVGTRSFPACNSGLLPWRVSRKKG